MRSRRSTMQAAPCSANSHWSRPSRMGSDAEADQRIDQEDRGGAISILAQLDVESRGRPSVTDSTGPARGACCAVLDDTMDVAGRLAQLVIAGGSRFEVVFLHHGTARTRWSKTLKDFDIWC